jgi:L-rhamnose isomerase
MNPNVVRQAYDAACETYAAYGVEVTAVLEKMRQIEVSVHCWQGDDVTLESSRRASGGILSTVLSAATPERRGTARGYRPDSEPSAGRNAESHATTPSSKAKVDRDRYETRHSKMD